MGIGVVPHQVANTDVMSRTTQGGIGKNRLECFEIGVNITQYGKLHR
jgi:hypothetical protein